VEKGDRDLIKGTISEFAWRVRGKSRKLPVRMVSALAERRHLSNKSQKRYQASQLARFINSVSNISSRILHTLLLETKKR
jgi:hypothetical protein